MNDATRTVGELVVERPARSRVFEELGIDYCCGGKISLADACARKGLEAAAVLERLAAADQQSHADCRFVSPKTSTLASSLPSQSEECHLDPSTCRLSDLCHHIVITHHDYLRKELPQLRMLLGKLARVHGDRHAELRTTYNIFCTFADEMEQHMHKEERVLFPLISRTESSEVPPNPFLLQPIAVMEAEHDDAGRALAEMRQLNNDFTPPSDGCNTYRATMARMADLEADLHIHVHKENNILFPRAAQLVNAASAIR